jgi:hypothetical protein
MATDISAQAMSLAQYGVMSNDPLVQAVTFSLLDMGNAMADIPFVNKKSLIANGVRWEGNLPSVNWGSINSDPVTTIGTPTPYQEQAYVMRNSIDVDKLFVDDENAITNPRSAQLAAYLKGVTYDFNYKFIKNDHTSGDANSFVGLRYRLDNPATYGVWSSAKINANGQDLSPTGMTAATANGFLELLDQLIWSVDGGTTGEGVCLYMNEVMQRRIDRALRLMGTSGGLSIVKDQFDRTITQYKAAQIKDIGYKSDQATRIITTTETAAGLDGSSTFTSIYAVHYDTGHLFGWQYEPVKATDLGLLNNGVIYRTLVDWAGGLMSANLRSIGRLYNIKIA